MSVTLSSGLTLIIPSSGDENWATSIQADCFQKISEHDHTGSGKGLQIAAGAIATDAVNDAKILLRNDNYLRIRNAAASADLSVLKADASDNIEINAGSGKQIGFTIAGSRKVFIAASGTITPDANNAIDIGTSSLNIANIYALALRGAGAGLVLGTANSHAIDFQINSSTILQLNTAGHLIPTTAAVRNLGQDAGGFKYLYMGNTSAPATPTAGGALYVESGALKYIGSSGTITSVHPA